MKYTVDYTYWSPGGNKVHTDITLTYPSEPPYNKLIELFTSWGQRVECIHSISERADHEKTIE
jgi:hypothetical protein